MLALFPSTDENSLIQVLRRKIREIEGVSSAGENQVYSTGVAAVDRLLVQGGLRPGTLCEWLSDRAGGGGFTLAYLAARSAAQSGKQIVISDSAQKIYAAALTGIGPTQLVILRPSNAADELWAIDQSLRCSGVAAVWADLAQLRQHDFRRLQLAAEAGGTLGLLCRPGRVRGQPSWSDVQFLVIPQPALKHRRLKIEVTRLRGGSGGASVTIEINDITGEVREASPYETHSLPAISGLALTATHRRQA